MIENNNSWSTIKRNRAILKGVLGGFIGRAASLGAPFLVMPVMLEYLGGVLFGIWMTATSVVSMAVFVDFGIGSGLLTKLSRAIGSGDYVSARGYISTSYVLLSLISLFFTTILGAIFYIVSMLDHGIDTESINIFFSCIAVLFIGIPFSVIQRVMYANQQVWINNIWQVLGAAASVVACHVAIAMRLEAWAVIVCYSFSPFIIMAFSSIVFYLSNPAFSPSPQYVGKNYVKDIVSVGFGFLWLSILSAIALNVDNVIVSYRLSPEFVTNYSVPYKLASLLGLIVTVVYLPLWSANAEAMARKDFVWIKKALKRMSFLGGAIVLAAGVILTVNVDLIIDVWMGKKFNDQGAIVFWLSVFSLCVAITSPHVMILNSVGDAAIQIKAWFFYALITICMKLILVDGERLWILPCISVLGYLSFVAPVAMKGARKHIMREENAKADC